MVVSTEALAGIALVELGLVVIPGPNMIYLVSRSVVQGRRAGLTSLAGVGVGFLVYLLAATAGLATLFALVPEIYLTLKLAGAAYLLWLAWNAFRPGGSSSFTPAGLTPDRPRKLFGMGLLTCLLNPKIAILYISLLPSSSTRRAAGSAPRACSSASPNSRSVSRSTRSSSSPPARSPRSSPANRSGPASTAT